MTDKNKNNYVRGFAIVFGLLLIATIVLIGKNILAYKHIYNQSDVKKTQVGN